MPPLLRTTAYDDLLWSSLPAVVQAHHERYDHEQRQASLDMLAERPHRRVQVVFGERVLRRLAVLQDIGADQLAWLVKLAELDNVTLQVVRDVDRPVAGGGFTVLSFLEDRFEDVVYVERAHGMEWLEGTEERTMYRTIYSELAFAERASPMTGVPVGTIAETLLRLTE